MAFRTISEVCGGKRVPGMTARGPGLGPAKVPGLGPAKVPGLGCGLALLSVRVGLAVAV